MLRPPWPNWGLTAMRWPGLSVTSVNRRTGTTCSRWNTTLVYLSFTYFLSFPGNSQQVRWPRYFGLQRCRQPLLWWVVILKLSDWKCPVFTVQVQSSTVRRMFGTRLVNIKYSESSFIWFIFSRYSRSMWRLPFFCSKIQSPWWRWAPNIALSSDVNFHPGTRGRFSSLHQLYRRIRSYPSPGSLQRQ